MELKRVNPGQAGATAVGVRVPRSNAAALVNARMSLADAQYRNVGKWADAASRSSENLAKGVGAILSAGVNTARTDARIAGDEMNEGIRRDEAERKKAAAERAAAEAKAEAAAENKRLGELAADQALLGSVYQQDAAGVSAELVADESIQTEEEFAARFLERMREKRRERWEAALKPRSEGGLGVRGIPEYGYNAHEGEYGEMFSAIDTKELWASIPKFHAERQKRGVGRALEAAQALSKTGVGLNVVEVNLNESLSGVEGLTDAQRKTIIADAMEGFSLERCLEEANAITTDAVNEMRTFYDAKIARGIPAEDAEQLAKEQAIAYIRAGFAELDYVKSLNGEATDAATAKRAEERLSAVEKMQKNAEAVVSKSLEQQKAYSDKAQITDMQAAVLNPEFGAGNFPLAQAMTGALSARSIYGNDEELRKRFNMGGDQTFRLTEGDADAITRDIELDIAWLDFENPKDCATAVRILSYAQALPQSRFSRIQNVVKDKIRNIGQEKVPQSLITAKVEECMAGLEKQWKDDKELRSVLADLAKKNPTQFSVLAPGVIKQHQEQKTRAASGKALVEGILSGISDDYADPFTGEKKLIRLSRRGTRANAPTTDAAEE